LFRLRDDALNQDLVKRVNATGRVYLSGTVWDDKPAARIAVSNWQVNVQRDGALIEEVLSQVAGGRDTLVMEDLLEGHEKPGSWEKA